MKKLKFLFLLAALAALVMALPSCNLFSGSKEAEEETELTEDDSSLEEDEESDLNEESGDDGLTAGAYPSVPGEKINPVTERPDVRSNYYIFCVRYDDNEGGGHDPHLHGETGQEYRVFRNDNGGYNWWFSKSHPSTGKAMVGVLADGTVFIKTAYASAFMSTRADIKAESRGYAPKPMQKGKVNGEDALVIKGFFKKK